MRPVLIYSAGCPRCQLISAAIAAVSLGLIVRCGLAREAVEALTAGRNSARKLLVKRGGVVLAPVRSRCVLAAAVLAPWLVLALIASVLLGLRP